MVHCVHQQTNISSHAVNTCDVCHNHQHLLSIMLRYQSKLQLYRCRCLTQLTKYTRHVTYISRLTLAVMLSIPVMFVPHYKLLTCEGHSINKLRNGIILLIFKIQKIRNIGLVSNFTF